MKLGVIGCGKMGSALVGGAIRAKAVSAGDVLGYDPFPASAEAFTETTGASTVAEIGGLSGCDTFLLCTKPHQAEAALRQLADGGASGALLISVAAGLSIDWLQSHSPAGFRVVRCMPNTPALVGEGAAAFALGTEASSDDASAARSLLGSVGIAHEVPESLLDAVTGLSGSGPAFAFLMIEALADGGVRCGLPRAQALELAAQTLRGAATMVLETGDHPAVLKDRVASPGGTTIAGLAAMEAGGVRDALIEAVTMAAQRSAELGKA
ncbi:pyrroline-5-carboxylate reductase [Haloferula helveola]|uniref:Pyrroline-5-carboxylate reductase n=1 Tax=Haloferula helveola TaxID=490095 RepID=A0ABN6GZN6_9BACT|nr:pyrroline-5-carboxylate reductase [Haloferula helveola]